jgi:hypothetical protein
MRFLCIVSGIQGMQYMKVSMAFHCVAMNVGVCVIQVKTSTTDCFICHVKSVQLRPRTDISHIDNSVTCKIEH